MNPDRVPTFLSKVNGSPLQSVYIVWRQVKRLNLLDDINLLSFRQSEVIEQWFDEFGESRCDVEWLSLLASLTDNSYPRLDWTLFILNQELYIKNTYSGTKAFHLITGWSSWSWPRTVSLIIRCSLRLVIARMHIECHCVRERNNNIFPRCILESGTTNHRISRSLSAISRGFGLINVRYWV
jgi:hypothetical protein